MTDFHGMSCAHCQEVDRADRLLSDIAKAIEVAHPAQRLRFQIALSALMGKRDGLDDTIVINPPESPFTMVDREV